jgi:hypothetical protein
MSIKFRSLAVLLASAAVCCSPAAALAMQEQR